MLTSGSVDLARVPASRRIARAANPSLPRERRAATRRLARESDARLLASATRSLGFVSRANADLLASRDAERSTVVRGGSLVSLRRDRRTRGGGIVPDGARVFARVGGERSDLPAVATLRVGSRTARIGAGESLASPGAKAI